MHLLLFLLVVPCLPDDQDVFSSSAELATLARLEMDYVSGLERLATQLEEETVIIREFLAKNYGHFDSRDAEQYVGHPVNSLALITRLSHNLPRSKVPEVVSSNSSIQSRKILSNLSASFPKESDWAGAANGIFLLQEHYNL